jgi:FtsZ-binding cell division protein ZapB
VKDLQGRIEAMELSSSFAATQEAVQAAQMEMLTKLREIRAVMMEGGNATSSSKELEALRAENEALKKTNTKQDYRIRHLVRSVHELQSKTN